MKKFRDIREKKLTKAELKKREEIAKAIEKDNPDMPMDKKMAIATATAKRVAEGTLAARKVVVVDALLKDLKNKLIKDLDKGNLKLANEIAKYVGKKIEQDRNRKFDARLKNRWKDLQTIVSVDKSQI